MIYYIVIISILIVVLALLAWAIWRTKDSVRLINNNKEDKSKGGKASKII